MEQLAIFKTGKEKQINKENIEEYEEHMLQLKKASLAGVIVRGIKETIKSLEANKCKKVYLTNEAEDDNYKRCIKEYCELYQVPLIEVPEKYLIRDTIMLGIHSSLIIREALSKGKIPKIMPNCHVAAIIQYGNVTEKLENEEVY